MRRIFQYMIWLFLGVCSICAAHAQTTADQEKIAASQAGASPLYFDAAASGIPAVEPGSFYNAQECQVRAGLPDFFEKIKQEKEVVVAFIGGSITQAGFCYRLQTARYLEQLYPSARFKWINAGVSGTGTELGAFRIGEQVLQHKPDLIFVEFAVNGAYPAGMEGMIRQTIKANPSTDICLLYTIQNGQTTFYQKNEVPPNIKGLEQVAAHYGLSSVHLGMEAASLEAAGKLIWKGSPGADPGKIIFSEDGIHPATAGGNLYAAAIARAFQKMKTAAQAKKKQLPAPVITANWDAATMVEPSIAAQANNGWAPHATAPDPALNKFNPWFATVFTANKPGASFRFRFCGDLFGLFDIGGPEAGQLEFTVDGKPVKLSREKEGSFMYYQANDTVSNKVLNRFNAYCNNRYRGQFDVIKLEPGVHDVVVTVSAQKADKLQILPADKREDIEQHPEKYDRSVIYLGRILIRGKLVKEPAPARIKNNTTIISCNPFFTAKNTSYD
ncbi:SGNH/GDSL hydrolase family protein [Niabella sp. CC-SYL272]|uniref:SGNH/GDSL hydrolase family protein n=1 Tax=Niabella agricola TaxID=2891571 RepID=UPI001F1E7930|nr:SGNH/GDSL hydrolase family protein [Niabella agricola]MCF3110584.1 SGNH/GDSL hydrolase family protein [Niabella agricola]